ncbi:MAG: methionyl-tRNA synthetase [Parcubacteria group bacterium LiPW_39]|nr:MAG: methionyl-tRNA synthetase [Parcubacteria group bacterium LiPW_39]
MNKFYITTPIYYVNDKPHIGHAYTTVAADVLARWHRSQGEEVFFLTGTDEHGAKVAQAAAKAGQSAREFCDGKAEDFKNAWQALDIQYDNFIRTTDPAHEAAVQKTLQILYDKGFIYKGQYEGLYCPGCEQYKIADDLIDGQCPDHQIEPQLMKEESYFFKLSHFQKELEKRIAGDELKIEPKERKNEVLSFIKSGLADISISRQNVSWGIPLPFDRQYTTYVWVDAFLNYLTGLGWDGNSVDKFKSSQVSKSGENDFSKTYKLKNLQTDELNFWPPDVQLMSKDILRVHATIWPGLLLALDIPLPKRIFVHGFFTLDGQKMSKSQGNVIWPQELVQKFGADASRYLLLASTPFGRDGDISWEKLTEKYNADLANGLGNLISRVFNLIESNFEGKVVAAGGVNLDIASQMRELKLFEALRSIKEKIDWANKYIDETKIWELVKQDKVEAKKVLGDLLGVIIKITESLAPFMPEVAEKILRSAGAEKIQKGEVLFPRAIL